MLFYCRLGVKGYDMQKTALRKWGNGQGVLIPRAAVEESGIALGDQMDIEVSSNGFIVLMPIKHRFRRRKKVTITELFKGYSGDYQPTELDWGAPQGKEMW